MSTRFRYFEHPHQFSTYQDEPQQCEVCGREQPGYTGPFYGLQDVEFVCEECLATGRLQEHDITTNEGNATALREHLRALHPDLSDEEMKQLAQERTVELEQRTPHVVTWQDFFWPALCGDYRRFIQEVGKPDLIRLSPDGNGMTFFAAHTRDIADLDHAREVWDGIRADSPADGRVAYSVGVYLFRCLTCEEPILLWDCD
jgi:uncharacterized protein CbrC (UPF0167 family)